MPRWFYALLVFAVLAPLLTLLQVPIPPTLLFVIAGLGILPLAALIGQAIEQIAEHTGERIGGLLFATFGNAPELIIGIFALKQGLVDVVSASIIGSILGNVLLVLGVALCVGGFKHGRLKFEQRPATQYGSLLALCVAGLLLPTVAESLATRTNSAQMAQHLVELSDYVAVLLLCGYIASILFSIFHIGDGGGEDETDPILGARSKEAILRLLAFRHHIAHSDQPGKSGVLRQIDSTLQTIVAHETEKYAETALPAAPAQPTKQHEDEQHAETASAELVLPLPPPQPGKQKQKGTKLWQSLLLLAVVTASVAWLSDILVGSIEPLTQALHWNPSFVGLVFVPLIGGLPEYFNTISMVLDKRVGMVLAASAGSSIQIALLMTPILVLVSLLMPQRLTLVFSLIELVVLILAAFLFSEITKDGELVWLEGLLLILLYAIMGGTVFLFGA